MKSFFHAKTIKNIILAGTVVALGIFLNGCGRSGFENNPDVYVTRFDFEAVDGSYDMKRYNLGSNALDASHVEYYRVILELSEPVKKTEHFRLQIMADGGQSKIGIIDVTIPENTDTPVFVYQHNMGAKTTPTGMLPLLDGQFWLACTSPNGHPRGNADHAVGTGSQVVLRMGFDHEWQSEQHQIDCVWDE